MKQNLSNDFYCFKNITEKSADLYITGEITANRGWWDDEDELSQSCLKDFLKTLKDIKDVEQLNIYINSPGGEVFSGLNMYNALTRHKANKTVFIDGMAASAASLVAMAGNKIVMPKNTFLMIHKPWTMAWGNSDDLLKVAETLDAIENGMMTIYQEALIDNKYFEIVKQMVTDETWLDANEAKKYFKNIEIDNSLEAVASLNVNYEEYKNIFESFKNMPEELKMKGESLPAEKQNELIIDINECIKNVEILIAAKA